MPRPPKPAALKRKVIAACAAGMSFADAARKFGISRPTVKKWVDAAPAPAPALPDLPPAEKPAELEGPPPGATTLEVARWMRDSALQLAVQARADGNSQAAATFMRSAGEQGTLIARLEKQAAADGDTLRFSKAEIDDGVKEVVAKFGALAARPVLCAHCSRQLSGSWAGYDSAAIEKLAQSGR